MEILTDSKEALIDSLWVKSQESSKSSVFINSLQGEAAQKFQLSENEKFNVALKSNYGISLKFKEICGKIRFVFCV